jgi:hypothetical protein
LKEHTASIFRTDDRWSMFFWNVGTVLKPKDQLWHHLTSSGSVIKLVKKMKVISNFWKALKFCPTFDIYILYSGIYNYHFQTIPSSIQLWIPYDSFTMYSITVSGWSCFRYILAGMLAYSTFKSVENLSLERIHFYIHFFNKAIL